MTTPEAREERRKQAILDEALIQRLVAHMDKEDSRYDNGGRKWHVGKEVPIAMIVAIIVQTCGVIWWAASTAAKVEFIKESSVAAQIVQTSVDRKQDEDARQSENRIVVQLDKLNSKLDRLIEVKK